MTTTLIYPDEAHMAETPRLGPGAFLIVRTDHVLVSTDYCVVTLSYLPPASGGASLTRGYLAWGQSGSPSGTDFSLRLAHGNNAVGVSPSGQSVPDDGFVDFLASLFHSGGGPPFETSTPGFQVRWDPVSGLAYLIETYAGGGSGHDPMLDTILSAVVRTFPPS